MKAENEKKFKFLFMSVGWREEKRLWCEGYRYVAGLDEVGYGAWAGPVVTAVVIWPKNIVIYKLDDSKKLKFDDRERLAKKIKSQAFAIAVGEASVEEIADLGLGVARDLAMTRALEKLPVIPDYIITDAVKLNWRDKPCLAVIKGDAKIASVAAASIVAKVYRDDLMKQLSRIYKRHGFARHKGYGTKYHQEMILKYGLTGQHRVNYNLKFLGNN